MIVPEVSYLGGSVVGGLATRVWYRAATSSDTGRRDCSWYEMSDVCWAGGHRSRQPWHGGVGDGGDVT